MQGIYCKDVSLGKWSSFRGNFVRFAPGFKNNMVTLLALGLGALQMVSEQGPATIGRGLRLALHIVAYECYMIRCSLICLCVQMCFGRIVIAFS